MPKSDTTLKNELNNRKNIKLIAKQVKNEIDEYCKTKYDSGFRNHLGASEIGQECKRFLWYKFRWCFKEEFSGRMQRLFNRGHKEENRFIEWLNGIGFEIWQYDLFNNRLFFHPESESYIIISLKELNTENYSIDPLLCDVSENKFHINHAVLSGVELPQFKFSAVDGHFCGSCDGIAKFPKRYNYDKPVLLEFKTQGTGSGFTNLVSDGMQIKKPIHYAQTCCYGNQLNLEHVLYFVINKNDDDLHVELTPLNKNLGEQMVMKAEQIIISETPPPKLSEDSTFYKCKYCAANKICHENDVPLVNCRSCKHAKPVENAQWFCKHWNSIIPKKHILKACPEYKALNQHEL